MRPSVQANLDESKSQDAQKQSVSFMVGGSTRSRTLPGISRTVALSKENRPVMEGS